MPSRLAAAAAKTAKLQSAAALVFSQSKSKVEVEGMESKSRVEVEEKMDEVHSPLRLRLKTSTKIG
ncbi:MAG: hypothetical protein IKZ22_09690, partial [Kiritimatiellae bacterium]|nr:hypothetical protein [Kiritimatiellia bacterium]